MIPNNSSSKAAVKNRAAMETFEGDIPAISIIVTAYNYGRFIGKTIESVLSQDFMDFELLILNNASTDNTDEIVKTYLFDKRIRYTVNDTNIGVKANSYSGLTLSRAAYILFLAADDFLLPGALSVLHREIISDDDIDFVFGKYVFVDNNNNVINEKVNHPGWLPYSHKGRTNELADLLQFDCYMSVPTMLLKREVFDRFGFFIDTVRHGDYEFFVRLAAGGCTSYFVNTDLAAYRLHGNQLSVGGDVISSGSQVNDQLTLIERYVTHENYAKLAGYETGILNMLACKLDAFNRCPQKNMQIVPDIQRRVTAVMTRINQLKDVELKDYPVVSVIVPTRNRPELLRRALQSILNQTYPNYEIVLINDGGEDVQYVVDPLNARKNIHHIRHDAPKERSAARNTGLRAARGKYIAYLDDDDRLYPDHLRILVNFLESNKVKVAYTDAYRVDEELVKGIYRAKQRQLQMSRNFDMNRMLVENLFPNLCIMHEKACLDQAGMFDETLETHEDWDMWIRLSRYFCFHHIPVVTAEYSFRNDKTNTTTQRQSDFNKTREIIFQKYRHYAEMYPAVLEAQKNELMLRRTNTLPHQEFKATIKNAESTKQELMIEQLKRFLSEMSGLVEIGDFEAALVCYEKNREKFPESMPEMVQINMLMARVRAMRDRASARVNSEFYN